MSLNLQRVCGFAAWWLLLGSELLAPWHARAETPEFVWVAQAGGGNGHAKTRGIAVDLEGNTYVTGEFSGTAIFGATTLVCEGPLDCYVAKFGPDGRALWANRAGGAAIDRGYGIAVDASGSCYVTGHFQQTNGVTDAASAAKSRLYDIFVAKYDAQGKLAWLKDLPGGGYNYGHGVALDGAGNPYVSGAFSGRAVFDHFVLTNRGGSEIFLARLDAQGKVLWVEQSSTVGTAVNSIAHDKNGHCYVAGSFSGKASIGGTSLLSRGVSDALVVKYDAADGKALWARRVGGPTNDFAHCVSVDAAGNCYISGAFQGESTFGDRIKMTSAGKHDAFVAKYDRDGNFQWAHQGGAEGTDYALGVAVDSAQNCFVTGEFTGAAAFGGVKLENRGATDIFLAKLNAAGKQEWVVTAGGAKSDYSYCLVHDGKKHVYLSGGFTGAAVFGRTNLTSRGLSDMFIAKVRVAE